MCINFWYFPPFSHTQKSRKKYFEYYDRFVVILFFFARFIYLHQIVHRRAIKNDLRCKLKHNNFVISCTLSVRCDNFCNILYLFNENRALMYGARCTVCIITVSFYMEHVAECWFIYIWEYTNKRGMKGFGIDVFIFINFSQYFQQ